MYHTTVQLYVWYVEGVLLSIGGWDGSKSTSTIYALHPVDQKWQHVGDMPFESHLVDTLLLSDGRLLVVGGFSSSQTVLRVTVEGKPCKCYGQCYYKPDNFQVWLWSSLVL